MVKCPCKDCSKRTLTCHYKDVCEDWKKFREQILTDIRGYLAEKKKICDVTFDLEQEMFIDTLLADLTEYAEKLEVEL